MNPNSPILVSCDYLIEFEDDAAQLDLRETETIVLPPQPEEPDMGATDSLPRTPRE